ncbi:uncharacterized protein N7515_000677 [Penicillium bovifimosum]|uniref:Uncharacterized protein n=1 Tax=Penicillium bovifimosum TaxID=126998 RepID=A0A9W9HG73_9EURO|nr:uncharacterized protein N7515_000677 [Penicillium bovifimosum]KAJ5146113.1 hypothetical protein N7515_000677 [Penicillium bovifimosum]
MVFGRRKRSVSAHHQPLSTPAAHSAQSAASHAFLKSQPSSASLSSAAAAAALRNLTPTPTPIEDVQTKRMVRRGSVQSQVGVGGRRSASVSATLGRSNSNSSMSARTFREQSPHRPVSRSGPVGDPVDVPPLPSLPTTFSPRKLPNRRALSMEPSMRTSPSSPPRAGRRGVDREQGRGSPIQIATHQRVTSLGTVPEVERSGSRSSVNFSYPLGSRPTSPNEMAENNPISLHEAIQESIADVPDKSTSTKARVQPGSLEGSPVETRSSAASQAADMQKDSPRANARTERIRQASGDVDHLDQNKSKPVAAMPQNVEHQHPTSRDLPEKWPSAVQEQEKPKHDDTNVEDKNVPRNGNRMTSASPTTDCTETAPVPQSPSQLQTGQRQLRQSSSPGRSTRFSGLLSVSGTGDQIHEPPPRSVSPAKSALKNARGSSLSPDRRAATTTRVLPPSELSDGTSVASDEGSRLDVKKKPAKVSFDDEAEVVGVAASPPTSPEEYVPDSPPGGKTKSRMSWLGVGKKKSPAEFTSDDDWDVVIKPRQVLPSFGSIRGSRGTGLQRSPIPGFSDNESTTSSESEVMPQAHIVLSDDHTVGNIPPKPQQQPISQPQKANALEQLSVGGSSPTSQANSGSETKREAGVTSDIAENQPQSELSVPVIAVEPATPPADEPKQSLDLKRTSMDQFRCPGGFPPSGSDGSLNSTAKKTRVQAVASTVPKFDDVDTEEESGDSVYSDAAEDIDGDGFGSINAIVDSRSAPRSAPILEGASESRDATPKPLSRAAIVDSQSQDVTDQPREEVRAVTPTQESVNRVVAESAASSVGHGLDSSYQPVSNQPQPRASPIQNGSVRAEPTARTRPMSVDVSKKSNMQDPRWSSNGASPRGGKSKPRPLSLGPAFQKTSQGFPNSLRRQMSNGSDSSSSFKRSSPRADAHPMRRTMRSGAAGADVRVQSPTPRNDSPLDNRPVSSGSNGTMRKTLRGSAAGERYSFFSTNKKAAPRAKFTKAPPKSGRATRFADSDGEDDARPQTFTSRFADSTDEDEPASKTLRPVRGIPRRQDADDGDSTELDDSSEEGTRQKPQPVLASRPMTAPPGSGGKNAPSMSGMAAVAKQRGMSQRDLEEFLMAPPRGRKPGLLTRLGILKPKHPEHRVRKADMESPSRRDTPLERSRLEREQLRNEGTTNGYQSRTVTTVSAGNGEAPRSSKLVKRNSKRQSPGPDNWPLPTDLEHERLDPVAEDKPSVPSSAHAPRNSVAPTENAAARNESADVNGQGALAASTVGKETEAPRTGPDPNDSASETMHPEEPGISARDVVIAGSGRKKRFPLLRKAFGMRT